MIGKISAEILGTAGALDDKTVNGQTCSDAELAIGTPVYMQVRWGQTFGANFPVEFYISDCIVSDADNHEYKFIEAGCGEPVVDGEYSPTGIHQPVVDGEWRIFTIAKPDSI